MKQCYANDGKPTEKEHSFNQKEEKNAEKKDDNNNNTSTIWRFGV